MSIGDLKIGVIGGTGDEGRGLALRWAMAGARVSIGSRTRERAEAAAADLNQYLPHNRIAAGENSEVVGNADFALLTVPFAHAASTLESLAGAWRQGTVLIDTTVPVAFEKGAGVRYLEV